MTRSVSPEFVREVVVSRIAEIGGFDRSIINDSACLDRELSVKSIIFVEFQVAIEEDLDIELDPLEMIDLNRLDLIIAYVYGLVAAKCGELPPENLAAEKGRS